MKFLIVDDNDEHRAAIIRRLKRYFKESHFTGASSGDELEQALAREDVDVVITDYLLHWTDGLRVLSEVTERMPNVPVIMVTGSGSEEVAAEGVKRGLSDYIPDKKMRRLPVAVSECLNAANLKRECREDQERLREAEARYRTMVERIPAVIYIAAPDRGRRVFYISPQLEILLGYTMREWCNIPDLWHDRIHPDDLPRVKHEMIDQRRHRNPCRSEYRMIARDGRTVWVCDEAVTIFDDDGRQLYVQGFMTDITDRRRAEEELRLLLLVTMEISEMQDLPRVMQAVLRRVCEMTGWACGEAWMPSPDGSCLEYCSSWHGDGEAMREFMAVSEKFTFRPGMGLPGQVWVSKKPMWERDMTLASSFSLASFALEAGLKTCMAIPVLCDDSVVAVLDFFVHELREEDERLMGVVSTVARQVGALIHRKGMEASLRESEERYALAAMGANDGLWDWKLQANHMYFSRRWKEMLGYEGDEIGATPEEWFRLVHPDDVARFRAQIKAHLDGKTPTLEAEYRIRCKDGSHRWMLCRGMVLRDASMKPSRMAGSQSDITRRKEIEAQLAHDAMHDPMTGLANRILFTDRLRHAMERAQRHEDYQVGVMYLDIDNLKLINDSRGHGAGDRLLVRVARALESCLRPEDTLARMGGDEFAILLDDIKGLDGITQVADRLLDSLKLPVRLESGDVLTSASIGIVISRGGEERPENVLRDADIAMYRAKSAGGARYEIFDQAMRARVMERHRLESELRLALERGEFRVYYQPIVLLQGGGLTEAEALLRWQHPEKGVLLPSEFMQIAEETGLIVPIGEWVLRDVCTQSRLWRDAGLPHLRVMVNVSARQFHGRYLPTLIKDILRDTGAPSDTLGVEITESLAMQDTDYTAAALAELDGMGIGVSLDDFGTGYSSLAYLKKFPIEALKIDQTFVRDIPACGDDMAIASAIIAMAHRMNIRAIAEGVESEDQLAFLRQQHCDGMQGFFFNRPVSAETMTGLLARLH